MRHFATNLAGYADIHLSVRIVSTLAWSTLTSLTRLSLLKKPPTVIAKRQICILYSFVYSFLSCFFITCNDAVTNRKPPQYINLVLRLLLPHLIPLNPSSTFYLRFFTPDSSTSSQSSSTNLIKHVYLIKLNFSLRNFHQIVPETNFTLYIRHKSPQFTGSTQTLQMLDAKTIL